MRLMACALNAIFSVTFSRCLRAATREGLIRSVTAPGPLTLRVALAMSMLAEATAALHAPTEALYAALEPYASSFVQIGYAACEGPVHRSLGLLAASRGDVPTAVAHLEAALRACAGAPALLARAKADLASARAGTTP